MGNLRIIGLGPTDASGLTAKAVAAIEDDSENFLRTEYHDAVDYFHSHAIPYTSYDHLYDTLEDFDSVYRAIADDLIERSKTCEISYFVPGHPLVAEKTVVYLLEHDPTIEIIDGLSFIEPVLKCVKKDPVEGLRFIDGDNFSDLDIDVHVDMLMTQVYNRRVASDVKLVLSDLYGDEHEVYVLNHAGHPEKEAVHIRPLYMLDRYDDYGYETTLYVPKSQRAVATGDVMRLVRRLRGKDGCPWDREQSHESMKANLIEEAYEAAYAISSDDSYRLEEELGDVLFQIIFHSELAKEEGTFSFETVVENLVNKMVHRHPHVFSTGHKDWEVLKAEETGNKTLSQKLEHLHGLPALMRGQKMLRKAEDSMNEFFASPECSGEERYVSELFRLLEEAEEDGIDLETSFSIALKAFEDDVQGKEEGN